MTFIERVVREHDHHFAAHGVLSKLDTLAQTEGGLLSRVGALPNYPGDPPIPVVTASTGDLRYVLPGGKQSAETNAQSEGIDGAGAGLTSEDARLKALAEALERYSNCAWHPDQFIWATARELGAEALDLDSIPRCSESELSHPMCPLLAPDKDAPLRWVRGVSLMSGRLVWLPAIMAYLLLPYASPGERIWLPISTGSALHQNYERALTSAICEVVERDAISLTWLQKIPWPRIDLDVMPAHMRPFIDIYDHFAEDTGLCLFDATTDIGIPTVYCVCVTPNNPHLATLVMCSTALDASKCVVKVMCESACSRIPLQHRISENHHKLQHTEFDTFMRVFDGAEYMGLPERRSAFDFLFQSGRRRRLSDMPVLETGDPRADLALLLEKLRAKGYEVIAVDQTTDEAARVGMRVVRAIIPGLQPLSFSYRARYLGHPRLYDAPRRLGYPVYSESEINPFPQPFA